MTFPDSTSNMKVASAEQNLTEARHSSSSEIPPSNKKHVSASPMVETKEPSTVALSATTKNTLPVKKRKRKQREGMPKRPLSAYNFYFQHEREQLLQSIPAPDRSVLMAQRKWEAKVAAAMDPPLKPGEKRKRRRIRDRRTHGKIGFADLARNIAKKWKSLDLASKRTYEEKAVADKKRYKLEVALFRDQQACKVLGKKGFINSKGHKAKKSETLQADEDEADTNFVDSPPPLANFVGCCSKVEPTSLIGKSAQSLTPTTPSVVRAPHSSVGDEGEGFVNSKGHRMKEGKTLGVETADTAVGLAAPLPLANFSRRISHVEPTSLLRGQSCQSQASITPSVVDTAHPSAKEETTQLRKQLKRLQEETKRLQEEAKRLEDKLQGLPPGGAPHSESRGREHRGDDHGSGTKCVGVDKDMADAAVGLATLLPLTTNFCRRVSHVEPNSFLSWQSSQSQASITPSVANARAWAKDGVTLGANGGMAGATVGLATPLPSANFCRRISHEEPTSLLGGQSSQSQASITPSVVDTARACLVDEDDDKSCLSFDAPDPVFSAAQPIASLGRPPQVCSNHQQGEPQQSGSGPLLTQSHNQKYLLLVPGAPIWGAVPEYKFFLP